MVYNLILILSYQSAKNLSPIPVVDPLGPSDERFLSLLQHPMTCICCVLRRGVRRLPEKKRREGRERQGGRIQGGKKGEEKRGVREPTSASASSSSRLLCHGTWKHMQSIQIEREHWREIQTERRRMMMDPVECIHRSHAPPSGRPLPIQLLSSLLLAPTLRCRSPS